MKVRTRWVAARRSFRRVSFETRQLAENSSPLVQVPSSIALDPVDASLASAKKDDEEETRSVLTLFFDSRRVLLTLSFCLFL